MIGEKRAVIFDLDGTLLDTLEDLADSGNAVLRAHGFEPHPVDAYRTFIGNGMINLVRDIFPEKHRPEEGDATNAILDEYREAYERNWKNTTKPFSGIPELLEELQSLGIPIGVMSNKAHDFTLKCVETFLPKWEWNFVLGAREGVPKKPDPTAALEVAAAAGANPSDCYFIGDSDVDMMTAVNAGMHAVGVSWGFRPVDELLEHGATAILEAPSDLLSLLA